MDNQETIFDKIIRKEIPAKIIYEDDLVLAFHDINPQAPFHGVLIPKKRDGLTELAKKAEDRHKDVLGHMMVCIAAIAKQEKLDDGFRVVINSGKPAGQEVFHLHMHILGCKGKEFDWPPGTPGKQDA